MRKSSVIQNCNQYKQVATSLSIKLISGLQVDSSVTNCFTDFILQACCKHALLTKYQIKMHFPKNNVILKTQDMSQNKPRQNYCETVKFRLYFKVIVGQNITRIVRLVLIHILGFQDDIILRNMSVYFIFFSISCRLVMVLVDKPRDFYIVVKFEVLNFSSRLLQVDGERGH